MNYPATIGGGQLSRQISASYQQPKNIEAYRALLRQNSNKIEGWLEIKHDKSSQWQKKWIVFDDGSGDVMLRFSSKPELIQINYEKICLNDVVSFRIDSNYGSFSWLITYRAPHKAMIYFKALNKDDMQKWVFAFQKSTALVLTALMQQSSKRMDEDNITVTKRSSATDVSWTTDESTGKSSKYTPDYENSDGKKLYHVYSTNVRSLTTDDMHDADNSFEVSYWERIDHKSVIDLHRLATEPIPIASSPLLNNANNTRRHTAITPDSDIVMECNNMHKSSNTPISTLNGPSAANPSILRNASSPVNFDILEGFPCIESADDAYNQEAFFEFDEETTSTPSRLRRGQSYSSGDAASGMVPVVPVATQLHVGVNCGACSKKGPRNYQEDRFVAITDLNDELIQQSYSILPGYSSYSYFAVYDGHSGAEASSYLESKLHLFISQHALFLDEIEKAINESCISADVEFLDICKTTQRYAGTTAIGAFLVGAKLTIFNIGDCQAAMCTNGEARQMLRPHKPDREDELERIVAANGWITEEKELFMGRLHRMDLSDEYVVGEAKKVTWVTNHRVCGELAVSRSIGDPDYKLFTPGAIVESLFAWPADHNQIFYADLVIPDPECVTVEITTKDEFLILASDGLWDVVSNSDAVLFVKRNILRGKTVKDTAEDLCELALRLGSGDNVTVVIILFVHDDAEVGSFSQSLL